MVIDLKRKEFSVNVHAKSLDEIGEQKLQSSK